MGIQGLIPFLEKASTPVNVKEFSGNTVAIDAYCWLHKGVFPCADKLARGETCDSYIGYCMRFINMLLCNKIKPILVFDGQKLPAKTNTEQKRNELREQNRKKAAELMRLDKGKEAQLYLRRCIDITHEMALNLIRICRSRNIDCIVAPYEADAQLAYLNIIKIAQVIITEDSDLLLFGAEKVLFKMDFYGNGLLIEQEKLYISMGVKFENFSFDKFRHMCILSGCDYLSSLPGIGLAKACRFIKRTIDPNIYRAISRIGFHLNMPQLIVSKEYKDNFMIADFMFKYQPVIDPFKRKLVPLNSVSENDDNYKKFLELIAINNLTDKQICELAYGNLDPLTLKKLDDWSPNLLKNLQKTCTNRNKNIAPHISIWDENFVPFVSKSKNLSPLNKTTEISKISTKDVSKYNSVVQDEINDKENLAEQLSEFENIYKNQHKMNKECNMELLNVSKEKNASVITGGKTLKNSGVLSTFFSMHTSTENKKSNIVSRYFTCTNSDRNLVEINARMEDVETKQEQMTYLLGNLRKKDVQNNDDENEHVDGIILPCNGDSLSEENKQLTTVTSEENVNTIHNKIRKRMNPFVVTHVHKIDKDSGEDSTTSDIVIQDIKKIKVETTFNWAENVQNKLFNNDVSLTTKDVHTLTNEDKSEKEGAAHHSENQKETSRYTQLLRKDKTPFIGIRSKLKCRTSGLMKKTKEKGQSMLSMFAFRHPQRLKT